MSNDLPLEVAADAVQLSETPASRTFPAKFGTGGAFGLGVKPEGSLSLVGSGEITIAHSGVRLVGKRAKTFSKGDPLKFDFPVEEISDVVSRGKIVRFALPAHEGRARFVVLHALDAASALEIAALLPARQSTEFAKEQAELADFHHRLDAVSSSPWVTWALVAINVAVFVLMAIDGAGVMVPQGDVAIRWGSDYGPLTMGGQWWRLLTSVFIHFGLIHLLLNMWALYQTGAMTERLFGSRRFLALYVFAGLTGSLASLLWNPNVNSAGASGAIFGVFGGLLAFLLNSRNGVPRAIMLEHRNSTLLFAGYSLFYGAAHAGIDNAAHIGGLVGGFLIGLLLARPVRVSARERAAPGRLMQTAAGALLMLGLLVYPLARPSAEVRDGQAYQAYLQTFTKREEAAIAAMNSAVKAGGGRDWAGYAAGMRDQAAPIWKDLYKQIATLSLPVGSAEARQQAGLKNYLDARVRYCEATARAVSGDAASEAAAKQAMQDTEAALNSLK